MCPYIANSPEWICISNVLQMKVENTPFVPVDQ